MDIIIKTLPLLLFLTACTNLAYYPDRYLWSDPHVYSINFDEFMVKSSDGTRLLFWHLKSNKENPENLVLMFHGNAQNMSAHVLNLTWLTRQNSDILAFDYRGYGLSEGTPYPTGLVRDGERALQVAFDLFKKNKFKRLIVYAQSLGGSVALKSIENFSHKNEIDLLVLDSTFRNLQDVARFKVGTPLGFLVSGEAAAEKKLSYVTMPTLVIHNKKDMVIPFEFGKELYETIPSKSKIFWELNTGTHGDIFFVKNGEYRQKFLELLH